MNFSGRDVDPRRGFTRRDVARLALAAAAGGFARGLRAADPPFYADKSNLLVCLDTAGVSHPVNSEAGWKKRRGHIVANMELVMGALPEIPRGPLEIEVKDELQFEGYTRRRITYLARPGDRVPAYVMIPRGRSGKLRAAVCPHPTSNRFGKGIPAGVAGAPNRAYAHELAERGYVTISPDYPYMGERQADPYSLGYLSGTMKAIYNHIRAVDLLAELPQVDSGRIASIGHSLGGHNSLFVAVFEPRVRVVVTSCGFNAFPKYMKGDLTGWSSDKYMPRIAERYGNDPKRMPFDFTELLAAIAPRPVFINAPTGDDNFEVSGVKDCLTAAGPVYERVFGAGDRLVAVHPDCGHDFPDEVRDRAYSFMDRWLV
jgi:dienelactone hydrolase